MNVFMTVVIILFVCVALFFVSGLIFAKINHFKYAHVLQWSWSGTLSLFDPSEASGAALDCLGIHSKSQKEIDCLTKWANTSTSGSYKRALIGWLNYFQLELDEDQYEATNKSRQRELEQYDEERKKERDAVQRYKQRYKDTHNVPCCK